LMARAANNQVEEFDGDTTTMWSFWKSCASAALYRWISARRGSKTHPDHGGKDCDPIDPLFEQGLLKWGEDGMNQWLTSIGWAFHKPENRALNMGKDRTGARRNWRQAQHYADWEVPNSRSVVSGKADCCPLSG
jgi:hypothetical protein